MAKRIESALDKNATYRAALKPIDFFQIQNPSPDREYRFVAKTWLDKCGGFDRRGWEPITEKNSKGEALVSQWGTHSTGSDLRLDDLVLCFMPKERAEMKRRALQERNRFMRDAIEGVRNRARQAGMPHDIEVTVQRPGRNDHQLETERF